MSDESRYSDETLRDYAKGRLPIAEARALEAAASSDSALAAEIALVQGVIKAGQAETVRMASPELGWPRLSRAIDAEKGRAAATFVPERFSRWQVAAVAAAAILVWSLATAPFLLRQRDEQPVYSTASETPRHAYAAQTTFVPTAQERAIREALLAVNGKIVEGPSALGVYELGFKDAQALAHGVEILRARTDLVESIQLN